MEGIVNIKPELKKIDFSQRGKISTYFEDGRIIIVPLKFFPSIKALKSEQRTKWYILGKEGFSFDDCDEVFHIEQVLGREMNYIHN